MLKELSKFTCVTNALSTGGMSTSDQQVALRGQPDVVISTPGRILDHLLNSAHVHVELLEMVVFDEADRLLELGFREECLKILKHCARTRQTMLFSATLSTEVTDLAALTLKKPVKIAVDAPNKVVSTLDQEFVQVPNDEHREATLMALCEKTYTKRTIIFFQTKRVAHRAAVLFRLAGWKC